MSLAAGGHLTHGAAPNLSGKWFNAVQYVDEKTAQIDFDEVEKLAQKHKPKIILAADQHIRVQLIFRYFAGSPTLLVPTLW